MNAAFLQKAQTGIKSAKLLLDAGDTDGACSRAYYAMFDAARVMVAWAGRLPERGVFKSHGGLLGAFSMHLVQSGLFPVEPGRAIQRVQTLRQIADYEASPVPYEKAVQAVTDAEEFVAAAAVVIAEPFRPVQD